MFAYFGQTDVYQLYTDKCCILLKNNFEMPLVAGASCSPQTGGKFTVGAAQ